jgi:hypothetical protein
MSTPRIPSHRFEEHTLHYSGTRTRQAPPKSNVTLAREQDMQEIYQLAQKNNLPLDVVITRILGNSVGDLNGYVISKGETPFSDPTALALQAILLRAQDVATVANTLDITDEDALQVLENNLQEDIDTNSPATGDAPAISAQAAIACALQFMSEHASASGLPNTMSGITKSIQNGATKYRQAKAQTSANNDDFPDFTTLADGDPNPSLNDPSTDAAVPDLSFASVSSQLAAIPGGSVDTSSLGSLSPAAAIPSISVSASSLPQASSGTTTGGVLNSIASVLGSISNIATQATATANTLKSASSNLGASSIQQYVKNNSSQITIIVFLILIIIVAAILSKK